jgi:hypothetical protein
VPNRILGEMLVGVVTGFKYGVIGAIVSKIIVAVISLLLFSTASREVIDILFIPSFRFKAKDHIVSEFIGKNSIPFIQIEELVSLVPDKV